MRSAKMIFQQACLTYIMGSSKIRMGMSRSRRSREWRRSAFSVSTSNQGRSIWISYWSTLAALRAGHSKHRYWAPCAFAPAMSHGD